MSVYRKAAHIDRYLDFKSHHHPQHKHSVVRTLMDRAKNIPSTEEEALRETKRVVEALAANNYPTNFIHNGHQPNRQQEVFFFFNFLLVYFNTHYKFKEKEEAHARTHKKKKKKKRKNRVT